MSHTNELESAPLLGKDKARKTRNRKNGNRKRKRKSAFKGSAGSTGTDPQNLELDEGRDQARHVSLNDFDKTDSWGILHEGSDEESGSARNASSTDVTHLSHLPQSYFDHRPSIAVMEAINSSSSLKRARRPSTSRAVRSGSIEESTARNILHKSPREAERWARSATEYTKAQAAQAAQVARSRGSDVVIDVDALMDHVTRNNNRSQSSAHSSSSINRSSGGYHSQPSSRRSSNTSSLNDVCLPIDDKDSEGPKLWPDVAVLEEYSKEETERLRRQAVEDAENFHFQYDDEEEYDDENNNDGVLFSKPIVTNIDVPELGNTRINEADHMEAGRLRPKKITPWHLRRKGSVIPGFAGQTEAKNVKLVSNPTHKNQDDDYLVGSNIQYPPQIVSNNPEHFRFTYFREDLDATIHSPTISGLLQPGQKFDELFVPSVYANNSFDATPSETKSSTPSQQTPLQRQTTRQSGIMDLDDSPPFWLDVSNPSEEEMKVLSKTFGIHPLTTEDIFLGEVREKVELFKDYYLVCFRS